MKNIRILHLFPKLLSLYGEYGNVAILKKALCDSGYSVSVEEYEGGGSLELTDIGFVYVGSGTEDNIMEANVRLVEDFNTVKSSVAYGTVWLATGNAMSLFGKKIIRKGKETDSSGVFDYVTEIDDKNRYSGDVLSSSENVFSSRLVGYINTSSVYRGIENPLCNLMLGARFGNDKKSSADGILNEKFYGTQFIGPFMVKNPCVLAKIYEDITGEPLFISDEAYIKKAYDIACSELTKRLS